MAEGTFRAYGPRKKISEERMQRILRAGSILQEYESRGMVITLRQLYYQYVARKLIANDDREYDRLGDLVVDGRMAGLISWTAIEDRGRGLQSYKYHPSPHAALIQARDGFRLDKWARQRWAPEVWSEKEGPLEGVCAELEVDLFVVHGYNSASEQWRAGQRMAGYVRDGRTPIVFHVGDHDPSGLHMTEDNRRRLSEFSGVNIVVHRVALNMGQIERYAPPPNPVKLRDSRADAYVAEYGEECWEMDALSPDTTIELIRDAVLSVRDEALWNESLEEENADRLFLTDVVESAGGGRGVGSGHQFDTEGSNDE